MSNKFFLVICLTALISVLCPTLNAVGELILKENLKLAQPGDYLVTAQNKNYTILLIRTKDSERLEIEEITIPMARIMEKNFSWRKWIENRAPGNTCWVMYAIHLPTGIVQKTFSFTKNEWISIPQSQHFFSTLLNLRLQPIPENERKKVGPPPAADDPVDRRSVWQPKLIIDGKAYPNVTFDAWRTRWPKDGSELSDKLIEVYLPNESGQYPSYFPYWLQISGVVGKAKIRIIDSGSRLSTISYSKFEFVDTDEHKNKLILLTPN